MDGYVATFDSSIIAEDAGMVKPSTNKRSLETACIPQHTSLGNESVTSRLVYQREGTYLNAVPSSAKASISSGCTTDCMQPTTVEASSHCILNGKFSNVFLPLIDVVAMCSCASLAAW